MHKKKCFDQQATILTDFYAVINKQQTKENIYFCWKIVNRSQLYHFCLTIKILLGSVVFFRNVSSLHYRIRLSLQRKNVFKLFQGKASLTAFLLHCCQFSLVSVIATNRSSLLPRTLLRFAGFNKQPWFGLLRDLLYLEACKSCSASDI